MQVPFYVVGRSLPPSAAHMLLMQYMIVVTTYTYRYMQYMIVVTTYTYRYMQYMIVVAR